MNRVKAEKSVQTDRFSRFCRYIYPNTSENIRKYSRFAKKGLTSSRECDKINRLELNILRGVIEAVITRRS